MHGATRLVNHDIITLPVLVKYLDGFRRDQRLVTMNDIFDAIPVPPYRVRLGDLAVDSSDPRLERVSVQKPDPTTQRRLPPSADILNSKKANKKAHIILDRAIPEFSGDDHKYLPVELATFGHGRIRIPIGRDLA